jgi:UDP-glucose 4-epimerase
MKYLVTGGAGFIGSHLVDLLLADGHKVSVIDNFSTGSIENLRSHLSNPNLTITEGDILDADLVEKSVNQSERVFHFAAAVGVMNIMANPLSSLETNIRGSENVLNACANSNVPVLIASSSEIYGKNASDALSEDSDRIIGPPQMIRWSYSDAKAIDESLVISLHQKKGLETRIVRLFNTVGPRQVGHYGMVVPRFVHAALRQEPLIVFGNGKQTRCFGHVSDITAAIMLLDQSKEAVGRPINVGVNKEISIIDLANEVIKQTKSNSQVSFMEYKDAYPKGYEDMQRRVPDNSLLRRITNWTPKKTLTDIIEDISASYLDRG